MGERKYFVTVTIDRFSSGEKESESRDTFIHFKDVRMEAQTSLSGNQGFREDLQAGPGTKLRNEAPCKQSRHKTRRQGNILLYEAPRLRDPGASCPLCPPLGSPGRNFCLKMYENIN